jgi:alcohol dehydrogenase
MSASAEPRAAAGASPDGHAAPPAGQPPAGARPRGALRHYLGLLTPELLAGGQAMLERDGGARLAHMAGVMRRRLGARRGRRPQMQALQAAPGGRLRWRSVAAPAYPAPDSALVRPLAVATCDLDRPIMLGASPFPLPLQLGHECVAEVVAVGESVQGFAAGDRVVVPFQIHCGRCARCREGRTGNCLGVPPLSMYGMGLIAGCWGGAFAELLAVPFADAMLVALPDGVEPAAAASVADNVCDAYRHLAPHLPGLLARDSDSEVLIIGSMTRRSMFTPATPLYAGLIARALGARNVQLADARAHVRAHAERLGLEPLTPRQLHRRGPAPLVVDVSVSVTQLALALAKTAPDGICTSSGSLHRSTRIPTLHMYTHNVTLHFGRVHARAAIPAVLELIASRALQPQLVTSEVAPLADAPRALAAHMRGGAIKTVLVD